MNLQARLYDPVIGRFLAVDPLAEIQIGITPYHYCGNDPINAKDPSGLLLSSKVIEENKLRDEVALEHLMQVMSSLNRWDLEEAAMKQQVINGMILDGERNESRANYEKRHATTRVRVLIPTGDGPAFDATETFLTVPGVIENASTFVMTMEAFNQFNVEGTTYDDLQAWGDGSTGSFEVTNNFYQIIGEFDQNPNAYAPGWETPFISDGLDACLGASNYDYNNPNCSKSMNILFSTNCDILYAGHSHCDGFVSSPYNRDQRYPTPGEIVGSSYASNDYSIFNSYGKAAKIGVILRPNTVTFYSENGYLTIHKSYIMR